MLNQPANPDLTAPAGDPVLAAGNSNAVPALHALTAPIPNTKVKEKAYFVCTLKTAALHRTDGKKLPFINGVLATDVLQDIQYLRHEVENGNPYIREASPDEVQTIEELLHPTRAVEARIRSQVERELRETIEKETRERLMVELVAGNTDAARIAGTDLGPRVQGHDTGEVKVVPLSPVSSTDIQDAAVGGRPSAAANAAAAALALARSKEVGK